MTAAFGFGIAGLPIVSAARIYLAGNNILRIAALFKFNLINNRVLYGCGVAAKEEVAERIYDNAAVIFLDRL